MDKCTVTTCYTGDNGILKVNCSHLYVNVELLSKYIIVTFLKKECDE